MDEVEKLKNELKDLNAEYAKIKDVPLEKRSEFGKELNARKMDLLDKIMKAEEARTDAEVEALDITAPCAPNEDLPELYSTLAVRAIL